MVFEKSMLCDPRRIILIYYCLWCGSLWFGLKQFIYIHSRTLWNLAERAFQEPQKYDVTTGVKRFFSWPSRVVFYDSNWWGGAEIDHFTSLIKLVEIFINLKAFFLLLFGQTNKNCFGKKQSFRDLSQDCSRLALEYICYR